MGLLKEPSRAGRLLRTGVSFPVLLGAALAAVAFATARLNLPDPDMWWHIAVGERILNTGSWPTTDIYSFTAFGHEWMAYEWLGGVLLAGVSRWNGFLSLTALLVGLCALLLLLVYWHTYRRCGNAKAAVAACAVVWPFTAIIYTLRPQLLGYILLVFTLVCLEEFRRGRRRAIWLLPVVFLLWVNTHGTFIIGLFIVGWYWLSGLLQLKRGSVVNEPWTRAQQRQLLVALLLCVLVLPLTPYGTRVATYPFQLAFLQPTNVANIVEWQPVPLELFLGKYFLVILLLFFTLQLLFPAVYRLDELGLFLIALYAACVHRRFLVFFAVAFAPLLAVFLARWVAPYRLARDKFLLNAALLVMIVLGMVVFFPTRQRLEEVVAERFPRDAVAYMSEHPPPGPLLNEYAWGGYLIWARRPAPQVFVDGRVDFYEYAGVFPDYLKITRLAPDTLFLLRKYRVRACLLEREDPLSTFLAALPEWQLVYTDKLSALYVRQE